MPPHSLLSSTSTTAPLRVATLNVGLGLVRKLPDVLSRCICLSLHVLALQEIGDPALTPDFSAQYAMVCAPGPSSHDAGVGLLVARDLLPYCVCFLKSTTGRLVATVLELQKDHRILIASVYMPTGIDHLPAHHDDVASARALYHELLSWTRDVQHVIVMGDLNETLTLDDRFPRPLSLHPAAVTATGPIHCLPIAGFTDAYRLLHPAVSADPGFTHIIESDVRPSRSRIDYIWTLGIPADAHLHTSVETYYLTDITHHRLLWLEIDLKPCGIHCDVDGLQSPPMYRMKLPNLRAAKERQLQRFVRHLDRRLEANEDHLLSLADMCSKESLGGLAAELAAHARRSAFATLPITGDMPFLSKGIAALTRRCRDLIRIRNITTRLLSAHVDIVLSSSPEWRRLLAQCTHQHNLHWRADADREADSWLEETKWHLRSVRATIQRNQHHLTHTAPSRFDANPAARVHRMLAGDELPSQIYSVLNADGHLTTTAEELSEVMVGHFERVFTVPPVDPPAPLAHALPPPPDMLFSKPSVDPDWFGGLMDEPTEDELLDLLADTTLINSPGLDEVSSGVWKIAITRSKTVRRLVLALFSNCLLTATFPSAWKTSIIVPLVKDASKGRVMTNIRPISLQSCLGKLLTKLLARRLGAIFQRHPILHPAQRGFVLGGTTTKCIDEVFDAWDWSRSTGRELYTIFYDIKQAYDSVQKEPLERAMRRLRLPPPFIRLVIDSLSDLTSCVRTMYGITRRFVVERSLRQGDPLAPLLFIILMDALHDGLETNPFTGRYHGCRLTHSTGSHSISSVGYADDTGIIVNSLADLAVQNDWVQYFMRFSLLRLNPLKCELVGRASDGSAITAAELARHDILIDGVAPTPVDHARPIRYLGAHSCFNGDWAVQQSKAIRMIMMFTRVAIKYKLSVKDAVYMFNVFLITKLELAFHYVHGPGTSKWLQQCDSLLFAAVRHLVKSPLKLSHSALSLLLGLHLPSRMEQVVKVSEMFLRLNSTDAGWGGLGRAILRDQLPLTLTTGVGLPHPDRGSRLARAAYLLVKKLHWSATGNRSNSRRVGARLQHLFAQPSGTAGPPLDCSSSSTVHFAEGLTRLAHDCWTGWSAPVDHLNLPVHVYTDGSFDSWTNESSWSVVMGNDWLDAHYDSVPSEQLVQLSDVSGATLIGSNITCTTGVYPAELQAIARTLAMLPLTLHLIIHTDSKASIAAVRSFKEQFNERRRMRMAARPILQLIQNLRERRHSAGGGSSLVHIAAHTTNSDIHSIGNRLADLRANSSRGNPRSAPAGLKQLPLEACEMHFCITDHTNQLVIDDIRRTARNHIKQLILEKWLAKKDLSGFFACEGAIELGRSTLRTGTASHQAALVHLATNSMHFYWSDTDRRVSQLLQLECIDCQVALSIDHLAVCPSAASVLSRASLCTVVLQHLAAFPNCAAWLRVHHGRSFLSDVLTCLFPLPVTATPEEVILHLPRCMIGGFTQRECTHASRLLGFLPLENGRLALDRLRLKCLHFLFTHFQSLKPL